MRKKRHINTTNYNNITVRYIGELPKKRSVFFSFSKGATEEQRISVYISAIEAFLNGYDVIYIPERSLSECVEKAARDSLKGSIYAFFPKGLDNISPTRLRPPLISGGGVLSILENDAFFSFEALKGTMYTASSMSAATVLFSYKGRYCPHFIDDALFEGKDIAVIRSALEDRVLRELVRDGAEMIDSFSSFLINKKAFLFPRENGPYGIDGHHFDIIKL